jgi:hypothetical protein
MALEGLTAVSSESLRVLLRHVHRGEVALPLTIGELTRTGLQYCALELLAQLRTLDRAGVVAVVTAVLAEREATARRTPVLDVRAEASGGGHDGGDDNAFSGGSDGSAGGGS